MEEVRLVKNVVNILREDGGFIWWEKYEVLRRKYELGSKYDQYVARWKKIKMRNVKGLGGSKLQEWSEAV